MSLQDPYIIAAFAALTAVLLVFLAGVLPAVLRAKRLRGELHNALDQIQTMRSGWDNTTAELKLARQDHMAALSRISEAEKEAATALQRIEHLQEKLSDQKNEFVRQRDDAKVQFENLATRILEQSSQKLEQTSQKGIATLLNPLQTRIREFEQKVQETYDREARERFALKGELEKMILANQKISEDANNLTHALRGDVKAQGNWGELKLEMILERSGLCEGAEYVREAKDLKLKDAHGKTQRPDVIVYLPDEKHVIVDAKVSLTAYERLVSTQDETERAAHLRDFSKSIKAHVDGLAGKNYDLIEGLGSPDFVLMFCPIESAFSLLMESDRDLLGYAWERRVMLVTPTTLLAGLRTIASLWKTERQNKNAMEIARQGGALYDKFASFVSDVEKIGKGLSDTQKSYEAALNKLATGRGNLMSRTEKLRELGAKTAKKLELLED